MGKKFVPHVTYSCIGTIREPLNADVAQIYVRISRPHEGALWCVCYCMYYIPVSRSLTDDMSYLASRTNLLKERLIA